MKTKSITLFLKLALLAGIAITLFGNVSPRPSANADSPLQAEAGQSAQQGGVMFVGNMGQFDTRARFQAQVGLGILWLADDALWLSVAESPPLQGSESASAERDDRLHESEARQAVNLKLSFPNANPSPRLESFDRQETVAHYYRGSDPSRWQTNVPVWGGVRYVDLYPGVDLEVSGVDGRWTWRLVCKADCQFALQDVRLRVEGSETVTAENGYLHLTTSVGDLALPLLTTEGIASTGQPTAAHIAAETFEVAAPFAVVTPGGDMSPQAVYPEEAYFGTYLGGSDNDWVYDVALSGQGDILGRGTDNRDIWIAGWTASSNFPTGSGGTSLSGTSDAFVTKMQRGAVYVAPAFSAYIGGSDEDSAQAIATDASGNVYVAGWTTSSDFATTGNPFDATLNGCMDVFVLKMDSDGNLLYASYLGGSHVTVPGLGDQCGDDEARAIAVDAQGIVYLTGYTYSQDFPTTPGAYDTVFSYFDVGLNKDTFVVKLDLSKGASGLLYSTFVGGGTISRGEDIAIDGSGNVYVIGNSKGDPGGVNHFPTTPGAYDEVSYEDRTFG
ncbi:MAG: SBBP repeat-containing protein, partial [Chloroflexi bacterium]|nr:SBBP repeat-containing protein [Chloroflexota bacterium]